MAVTWLEIVGGIFCALMAWSIGANDVANALGTSVGSGALALWKAIIIGGIFEFLGSVTMGSRVSNTFMQVLGPSNYCGDEYLFQIALFTTLIGAFVWLTVATAFSLPVSTTHSIVGSLIGVGIVAKGFGSILWMRLIKTVISWVTSPLAGGLTSFLIFFIIHRFVHKARDPEARALVIVPLFTGLTMMTLVLFILFSGPKLLRPPWAWYWSVLIGLVVGVVSVAATVGLVMHQRKKHFSAAGTASSSSARIVIHSEMNPYAQVSEDEIEMRGDATLRDGEEKRNAQGSPNNQRNNNNDENENENQNNEGGPIHHIAAAAAAAATATATTTRTTIGNNEEQQEAEENKATTAAASPLHEKNVVAHDDDRPTAPYGSVNVDVVDLESPSNNKNDAPSDELEGGEPVPGTESANDPIERDFRVLMILAAIVVSFSHGGNDVANSIGPYAAIITSRENQILCGETSSLSVPIWLLILGGAGIVVGLSTWGYRVIRTVGQNITKLTYSRGYAAQFGTALSVLICTHMGIPVSTTHVLVGSVCGVGLVSGKNSLNFKVLRGIILSWIVTIPSSMVVTVVSFVILRAILKL